MSDTRVSILTPPGTGAIATVAVEGSQAWSAIAKLFQPASGRPLPAIPPLHRFLFGKLGDGVGDEVVVAVTKVEPDVCVEIHCHGGRGVVRWVVDQFIRHGCIESEWTFDPPSGSVELSSATTLRTASILLDQMQGACERSLREMLAYLDGGDIDNASRLLSELASRAEIGRHLVKPWRVAVAGVPNVGKSSLVNALTGYQRSIVSPIAGTTRDVVTAAIAIDGWPVDLTDTAGLRETLNPLEAEGVDRATAFLESADLVVWVLDATAVEAVGSSHWKGERVITVLNKIDLVGPVFNLSSSGAQPLPISALTGEGIPTLLATIARTLVPVSPLPGDPVPFSPQVGELIDTANRLLEEGGFDEAGREIRGILASM